MLRFFADLWQSACRPAVFRRCGLIALVVGTLLSLVNQGDVLLGGGLDGRMALKLAANYLLPFAVSNLGAMHTAPRSRG